MQNHLTIVLITLLLTSLGASAQTNQPYGDTDRAKLSSHHLVHRGVDPIALLGYIHENEATRQELMDNLEVGIRLEGGHGNKIICFYITIIPREGDVRISDKINGSKIPYEVFNRLQMNSIRKGDTIVFEGIRVEDNARRNRAMNHVKIIVR